MEKEVHVDNKTTRITLITTIICSFAIPPQ
jgi:hypothetical protein